jgi:hypothetical protein
MNAVAERSRRSLVGRYYDPQTGQLLSVDPLVDTTNQPYAYVGGDPVDIVDPLGLSGGLFGDVVGGFDHYVVQPVNRFVVDPVIRHSGTISTVAGGAALVAYTFCWAGGSGCVVGAALSGISAGAASLNAAKTCHDRGVRSSACVATATGALIALGGSALAAKLATPEFESLPGTKGWMFAKAYGERLAGRTQSLVGAGSWALTFGAQQGLSDWESDEALTLCAEPFRLRTHDAS